MSRSHDLDRPGSPRSPASGSRSSPRASEPARKAGRPALTDDYWQALRDLFTRDVTHQGLRELLEHEAQETFRFLTREVSVADLERLPWYAAPAEVAVALLPRRGLPAEPVAARAVRGRGDRADAGLAGPGLPPALGRAVLVRAVHEHAQLAAAVRDRCSSSCSRSSCATSWGSRATSRSRVRSSSGCCRSSRASATGVAIAQRDATGQHGGRRLLRRDRARRGAARDRGRATSRARACRRPC